MDAREKAIKIEQSSVINVFKSSQFKEKTPFPSLESLEIRNAYQFASIGEVDERIYDIMHYKKHIRVSQEFYYLFLQKNGTLRDLQLVG